MKLLLPLILIILLVPGVESNPDEGWDMGRHDSQRSGFSPSEAPDTAYLLWEFQIPFTNLTTSPLGSANRIVLQASNGLVLCLDKNGKEVWRFEERIESTLIAEDKVMASRGNHLWCLNLEDGSILWETETTVASGSPLLTEDSVCLASITPMMLIDPLWVEIFYHLYKLLVGCEQCQITCHDIQDGEKTWSIHEKDDISSIAYDQGRFIVLFRDGRISSLDKNVNEKVWEFKSKEETKGCPALHGHQIVFAGNSHIFCLDSETGELFWKFPISEGYSPALAYDRVFVSSSDGYVYCVDEYTGELLWRSSTVDPSVESWRNISLSPPVVADRKVFVGSTDWNIYVFNADNGELMWRHRVGGAIVGSPCVVDGKVLVPSFDGVLYTFGIDPETYFQKAQTYVEQKNYERAQEYFSKAKEWYTQKGDSEKVAACDEFIEMMREEIQNYSLISESVKSAQEYFHQGNEALLQKKYDDALGFFNRSKEVYERINDKNEVEKCHQRIEYIKERIQKEDSHVFIVCLVISVILICSVVILLKTKYRNR